jgi:hypothetical protein
MEDYFRAKFVSGLLVAAAVGVATFGVTLRWWLR